MSDNTKAKRAKYFEDNSARNTKRQRARVARKFGNTGKINEVVNGVLQTARSIRRAMGDYNPVNEQASIEQHPEGRFAKSLKSAEVTKQKAKMVKVLGPVLANLIM